MMFRTLLSFRWIIFLLSFFVAGSSFASDKLITRNNHDPDTKYCWQRLKDTNGDLKKLTAILERDIALYQVMIEQALSEREFAIKIINEVNTSIDNDTPISPVLLETLNVAMHRGLELTDNVVSYVASNECWLSANRKTLNRMGLKPVDSYTRFKGFLVAFSATLALYDTYYMTAYLLNQNDRIRKFLNESDHGYSLEPNQLLAVTNTIFNTSNILLVKREIKFYEDNFQKYKYRIEQEKDASYMNTLIAQSPTYKIIRDSTLNDLQVQQANIASVKLEDGVKEFNRNIINTVSKFFGNVIGLVEERKGKLYNRPDQYNKIITELKAGDILLEKTPFRLTDKMIPGHWGHAAVWVGTKPELIELGIWDHPVVQKYHSQINQARLVVEALRSGVEMNSLSHFLNVDDIAIIRDPSRTREEMANRIIRALRQVGKRYDFNYDVETTDKIVCSELVYLSYVDISWPTDKVVGRYTISPDNIAYKATGEGPLQLVMLFHDGKQINKRPANFMKQLMETKKK